MPIVTFTLAIKLRGVPNERGVMRWTEAELVIRLNGSTNVAFFEAGTYRLSQPTAAGPAWQENALPFSETIFRYSSHTTDPVFREMVSLSIRSTPVERRKGCFHILIYPADMSQECYVVESVAAFVC